MLESVFQSQIIQELKIIFPGCIVLKNDANYIQGFPDLLVLWQNKWAALECKANNKSTFRPNQKYWINQLNSMSYASSITPETREEVLNELQQAFKSRRSTCVSKR